MAVGYGKSAHSASEGRKQREMKYGDPLALFFLLVQGRSPRKDVAYTWSDVSSFSFPNPEILPQKGICADSRSYQLTISINDHH